MKKETSVLLAGTVGFFTVLGIMGFNQMMKRKKSKKCNLKNKFQDRYANRYKSDDHDGVEFLALL